MVVDQARSSGWLSGALLLVALVPIATPVVVVSSEEPSGELGGLVIFIAWVLTLFQALVWLVVWAQSPSQHLERLAVVAIGAWVSAGTAVAVLAATGRLRSMFAAYAAVVLLTIVADRRNVTARREG